VKGTQLFISLYAAGLIDMSARQARTHMSVPAYQGYVRSFGQRAGALL
jgi:hypothetical protein